MTAEGSFMLFGKEGGCGELEQGGPGQNDWLMTSSLQRKCKAVDPLEARRTRLVYGLTGELHWPSWKGEVGLRGEIALCVCRENMVPEWM